MLDSEKFRIFISGTAADKPYLQQLVNKVKDKVTDISGMMSLAQFMSFIQHADGLVANSTEPLHIAAATGKDALGIFPPHTAHTPRTMGAPVAKGKSFCIG